MKYNFDIHTAMYIPLMYGRLFILNEEKRMLTCLCFIDSITVFGLHDPEPIPIQSGNSSTYGFRTADWIEREGTILAFCIYKHSDSPVLTSRLEPREA